MSAAVESAARITVESATTEAASATVKSAASESTVKAPSAIKTTSESTAKSAAEPRTGSDKDTAVEIAGTVKTIRRTRVRIISIVAVSARRRAFDVTRSPSDSDRYLSM